MSTDRKVRVRYYSGRMRVFIYSVLPDGRAFWCEGIASPTARIASASCDIDILSIPCPEIRASLGKRYAPRCRTKIVKAEACIRLTRLKIDTESVVSEIQDFRGTDLDRARGWWHRNKERLVALLPLTWQGVTYTTRFPEKFEQWLYSDKASPLTREIYIFRRLYRVRQVLDNATRS